MTNRAPGAAAFLLIAVHAHASGTDAAPPVAVDWEAIAPALYSTEKNKDYDRDFDAFYRRWRSLRETGEQWLYEPAATLALQHLRTGDDELLRDAEQTWARYAELLSFDEPDHRGTPCRVFLEGKRCGDKKYLQLRSEYLLRAITGRRTLSDDQVREIARHGTGGWTRLPYRSPDQPITERDVAAGLHNQVWAYAILGEDELAARARRMIGELADWQADPLDGFPPDGTFRHSLARHEGGEYPGLVARDRGFSAWMSALIGAELYYADVVIGDERIRPMVERLSRGLMAAYIPARKESFGCNRRAGNPYIAYLAAPLVEIEQWPDLGYYADIHTPDLWLTHAYGGNAEGVETVRRWFRSDCERSAAKIVDVFKNGGGTKRAFGWTFKNGTAPMAVAAAAGERAAGAQAADSAGKR